jgi:SH3 domain
MVSKVQDPSKVKLSLHERDTDQSATAARALYSYSAAIPEELSFSKGDVLAVLRLQDDGWWEAQIEKGRQGVGMAGLVPSNYLQRC